jgi:hypothetical protein
MTCHFAGNEAALFDAGGVIAIAGMIAMIVFLTISHTAQLYREETSR